MGLWASWYFGRGLCVSLCFGLLALMVLFLLLLFVGFAAFWVLFWASAVAGYCGVLVGLISWMGMVDF